MDKLNGNTNLLLIGQDSNNQLGIIKYLVDEDELKDDIIGNFCLERRDNKGKNSFEFLQSCDLIALNRMCQNNRCTTCENFNKMVQCARLII